MEDSRVCPICETANPPDAIHCEVCGERLVPVESGEATDAAEALSSDGAAVVGFAVEDSEEMDEPLDFDASAASDATSDGMPAFDEEGMPAYDEQAEDEGDEPVDALDEEIAADTTDEELMTAAPADETATMDTFDAAESYDEHAADELEADEVGEPSEMELDADDLDMPSEPDDAPDTGEHDLDDDFEHDEFQDDDEADELPADSADEFDADGAQFETGELDEPSGLVAQSEPDFLYSPMDGAAYPRGSAEYEEGFGPNGEELVATPPDTDLGDLAQDTGASSLAEPSGASMDDAELAAAAAPSPTVSAEFQAAFQARPKERPVMAPLPQPGAYTDPAVLTVYANRQPVMRLAVDMDEVLIGRRDPVADAYPDLDLTELDPEAHISRKHAYIYRQNKNYTLYAVSNAGTQLNADLLDLGDRRALSDGDVIVLAGKIAMKFELPKN